MDQENIRRVRAPMVLAAVLGLSASIACGSEAPAEKIGGGLGTGGSSKGGSGNASAAKGGSGGTVVVTGGTTGSGGSIGTGSTSSGGSAATAGGDALDGGNACQNTSAQADKQLVALMFMIDISGSMKCPIPELDPPCTSLPNKTYDTTRWTVMAPALKSFFSSSESAGLLAGISFFSRNDSCEASKYVAADSEIAPLPGAAMSISAAIDKQKPSGYTPTLASLTGALMHADAWANAHTDQQVVVVYATDGYPLGCSDPNNTIDAAAKVAHDYFTGKNAIRTYVLGIGPNLDDLNAIAENGGTEQALFVDTSNAISTELPAKLAEIRSAVAVDCVYNRPAAPAGQDFDGRVNVQYTTGSGDVQQVGFNSAADCKEGWQYTDDTHAQVRLCGTTCDTVKADAGARIDVLYGCTTVNVGGVR
jgi:hypothetical protein